MRVSDRKIVTRSPGSATQRVVSEQCLVPLRWILTQESPTGRGCDARPTFKVGNGDPKIVKQSKPRSATPSSLRHVVDDLLNACRLGS